jgi:hypothetical protein
MANQHIFNNNLIITGSVTASQGFYGDGSGLTGITAVAEWDGSRNGDANITGSFVVSGSSANVDFTNAEGGVSGSFSGSFEGNGSGLTGLNLNGLQASGSILTGSFTGSFTGDGSGLTNLPIFPYNGNAVITGSLTISGSSVVVDFTDTTAVSGSVFSGSFVGDGSGLTGLSVVSEWDGSRDGNASITGSFIVSGSGVTIDLFGDTTIDQNIEISNRNQNNDLAIGYQALPYSTLSTRNTIAIGCQAAFGQASGSYNILIGGRAGYAAKATSFNIAIGSEALFSNIGLDTGQPTTTSCNIAIGHQAGRTLTTGWANVAIGYRALYTNSTGNGNVAVGIGAGSSALGSSNVLVGKDAGKVAGSSNTIIGHQAGFGTTGGSNVLIGYQSALCLTSGINNVAVGIYSGRYASTTSTCNVYIGPNAGPSTATTQNNQLYIGAGAGETPLIRGDFSTGVVTINNCLKVAQASGSFVGDGSGLTGISGDGFPYNGAAVITGSLLVSQSTAAGTAVTVQKGHIILTQVSQSLNFDSDSAAAAGGVPLGGLYRSGNLIAIRLT